MQTVETEHYIFHYGAGTAAERDIEKIAALQEGALKSDPKEGVAKMTIFIVMLCLSALALACSIFSFLQRGPVLSTNFLVSKNEQKKKELLFLRIHFALFTIGFLLLGISALLRVAMLTYVAAILFVLTAITAIAFSIYTASS